jgi:hypothetical protein
MAQSDYVFFLTKKCRICKEAFSIRICWLGKVPKVFMSNNLPQDSIENLFLGIIDLSKKTEAMRAELRNSVISHYRMMHNYDDFLVQFIK